jgi:hypothetical protein
VRSSLRNRLLITFFVLMALTSAGTLFAIHRSLSEDLVTALNARLVSQSRAA